MEGPGAFPTAVSFIEHIATTRNLNPTEMSTELTSWRHTCGKTKTPKNNFYPGFDSGLYRPILEKFEKFCSGIDEASEFAGIESLSENLEFILGNRQPISAFDDLDTMNRDRAVDIIVGELETSLDRLSLQRTQMVIMEAISNSVYPGVEDHGINSPYILLSISFPAAYSLVCQQLGGCTGLDHPFIVAYCLESNATSHRLCNLPGSMSEAIYQTLTPVEHQQYLALLNWINVELSRYRATTGGR